MRPGLDCFRRLHLKQNYIRTRSILNTIMSFNEAALGKLAGEAELLDQFSSIKKSKDQINKISDEVVLAMGEPAKIELMSKVDSFQSTEKDIREKYSQATLKSTLFEIVVYKFRSVEPRANDYGEKFVQHFEAFNGLVAEPIMEPDFTEFSKMTPSERETVIGLFQDRARAAVQWRVDYEGLNRKWNDEKDELLDGARQCLQIIKGLCAGLESNQENKKDQP